MSKFVRALAALAALGTWSCGSSTEPGATQQVASISVTPSTPSVAINGQVPLQAEVRDASGTLVPEAQVIWTVQDTSVVSVSSAGVVTGLKIGSTQVAANALGKSGIATVTVTSTPAASVVVQPAVVDVTAGGTYKLNATVLDAGQNVLSGRAVAWASGTPAVATVDNNGLVTAIAPGSAVITATSGTASGTATVRVPQVPVASVAVTPSAKSIRQNEITTLTATTKDANGNVLSGRTVTWTITSGSGVVTLSSTSGQSISVTGGLIGNATIEAKSEGKTASAAVTTTAGTVATVRVTIADPDGNGKMKLGDQASVTAEVLDGSGLPLQGRAITWSTNSAFTIVSSSGTTSTGANSAATATVKAAQLSSNASISATETVSTKKGTDGIAVTLTGQ